MNWKSKNTPPTHNIGTALLAVDFGKGYTYYTAAFVDGQWIMPDFVAKNMKYWCEIIAPKTEFEDSPSPQIFDGAKWQTIQDLKAENINLHAQLNTESDAKSMLQDKNTNLRETLETIIEYVNGGYPGNQLNDIESVAKKALEQ